ncbi:MAG: hypothetical protein Q4C48_10070 [Lachnospiraceae bacterium]|nr:hypothetical protein [Lachnospiraceae bacterium]
MELTTDVLLRGTAWNRAIENLSPIFKTRTHYMIFMLSMTIGIMYDQRIEKPEENDEEPKSVPRNVLRNNDNGRLDFIFQAAILSTSSEALTEEERLELAFGEKSDFNKIAFLTQFANFGVTKIVELIGETPLESMENIKNFLFSTVEGRNLDIDAIPDDILLEEAE